MLDRGFSALEGLTLAERAYIGARVTSGLQKAGTPELAAHIVGEAVKRGGPLAFEGATWGAVTTPEEPVAGATRGAAQFVAIGTPLETAGTLGREALSRARAVAPTRVMREGRGARVEAQRAPAEVRPAAPLHDQARTLQARAAAESARFQGMVDEVAGKTGGRAVVAPIKTVENMIGKARRSNPADPGAALSGMKDVLRASIVMPDWGSYKAAARELASRASGIDNSLTVPKKSGYKGLHFTIDLGDGVRAEVQLHVEETYALAHGSEGTHGLYEGVRDVLHLPPDQVPPERRAQVDEYMRVVTPRYVAVKIPEDVTSELSSLRPSGPGSGR